MNMRKGIVGIVAILMVVSLMVSCSGKTKSENGKVTVNFWHLDSNDLHYPEWEKIAAKFMETHPNVDIKITVLENEAYKSKLATVMQSGNPPDIFRSWGGGVMNSYAESGLLKDITNEYKNKWDSKIGEGAVGVYSYKGKIYGLPYTMGGVGIWYNKELLAKVGYNTPPETWNDFLDCVKKLKAAGITPIALGEGDKWPGHFWWVYLAVRLGGKEAFDKATIGNGSFNDEPFVKAGELLQELIALKPFQEGFLAATYGGDQAALMGNGKAAMELMGQWAPAVEIGSSADKKGIGDKLGFMSFPAVEGGKGKLTDLMGGGDGLVIGKNAPKEAVEFLKYITSVENEKFLTTGPLGIVPTAIGAETALTDPNLVAINKAVSQAAYFQLYYDQYLPPATGEVVKDATQGLFAGTMGPKEVAAAVAASYQAEKK
ncbi:MAG TPA: extracellular solute-binding protein [Treponemataceae bacterium]|nr:extracellular solute-binding protein [Treponemataceae bacterium]